MGVLKLTYIAENPYQMRVVWNREVSEKPVQEFLSRDAKEKTYPSISPYAYAGNNPILFVDPNGKDLIHYINVILKDGTELTIATKRTVNNDVSIHYSEGSEGGNPHVYFTDQKITTTVDYRTNTITTSEQQNDYTSTYSVGEYATKVAKSGDDYIFGGRSSQADGYQLTSAFAEDIDGAKTDSKNRPGTVNIDLIMAALGAASKSGELPDIKKALGAAEALVNQKEIMEAQKDMKTKTPVQETKKDSCTYCHSTGAKGSLKPSEHKGGIVPAKGGSKEKSTGGGHQNVRQL